MKITSKIDHQVLSVVVHLPSANMAARACSLVTLWCWTTQLRRAKHLMPACHSHESQKIGSAGGTPSLQQSGFSMAFLTASSSEMAYFWTIHWALSSQRILPCQWQLAQNRGNNIDNESTGVWTGIATGVLVGVALGSWGGASEGGSSTKAQGLVIPSSPTTMRLSIAACSVSFCLSWICSLRWSHVRPSCHRQSAQYVGAWSCCIYLLLTLPLVKVAVIASRMWVNLHDFILLEIMIV